MHEDHEYFSFCKKLNQLIPGPLTATVDCTEL